MPDPVLLVADLVAVTVLVFGLYFPRHRRRDLIVAYLGVNVGVMAVSAVLSTGTVGAGLGLGLFGVLSIIRLRSAELGQHEIAYYFSALALGLLGGLEFSPQWVSIGLMALILLVIAIGDQPRLLAGYRSRTLVLDRAYPDDDELRARVTELLSTPTSGAVLHEVDVRRLDLVNDTTLVDVRFHLRRAADRTRIEPDMRPGRRDVAQPIIPSGVRS
jgi:hypothetical protein